MNSELGGRIAYIAFGASGEYSAYLNEPKQLLSEMEIFCIDATKEGHNHRYLDFLETGKSYVKGDVCPFCLARTVTVKRLDGIEADLTKRKAAKTAMDNIIKVKDKIGIWKTRISISSSAFYASESELKVIFQKLTSICEEELASEVQQFLKQVEEEKKNLKKILEESIDLCIGLLEKTYFHNEKPEAQACDKYAETVKQVIANRTELITQWEKIKQSLAERVPVSGGADQLEIRRWLLLEKVTVFFSGSCLFLRQYDALQKLESIQSKLETFEKAEVTRLLSDHAVEIKAYYNRLNRGEDVQFTGIEVKGGVRRQAKLKAEAFGRDVNPVTFFSEAHTNSLALSIYFPQRVDRNDSWDVVVLDDPVQSMDENHSQALIDILVDTAKKKQVIVLTHSKSFFKRMRARMLHLKPLVYHFYNNDDKGPKIMIDEGESWACVATVKDCIKKGDTHSLEDGSQHLRKAIESVCVEYLLGHGVAFNRAKNLQTSGFNHLFSECGKFGLPPEEIGKLKSLLDTSHSDSHAWSIADTTPGGLRAGTHYIEGIYNGYIA
jgi:ABC-type polar amino acid transport system ATPase subunit